MTATDYFQSYQDYFWKWEDEDGETVVAIPHDLTIAYAKLIEEVIEKIHIQGLPPFGSLLLITIATNPGGTHSLDVVYKIVSHALQTTDDVTLSKAIAFLKLVAEVPEQYKKGDLRVMLIQALFEQCHSILSISDSKKIVEEYRKTGAAPAATYKRMEFRKEIFDTEFRTISILGNKYHSVDDIIERIARIPDPSQYTIEFEDSTLTEAPAPVDLIDELIHDPKTFPVGSLIPRLWGGLNIPVHNTLPSQQPLGGISDLTNKGDYDKLLVSEFANDDLVFLSRLANNEALYIHREVPPSDERLERIILIDVSIKNWGNPKVIAFALMLAIAKHPKTDIACAVYVLGSERYYPVSIDTIHGIIEALQITEGSLHAAQSLDLFLSEHDKDKNKEILLITEVSTQKHPAVLKVMNEHVQRIRYLFLTDANGHVDVFKRQQNSRRHIQHLLLNLEELWKKRPTGIRQEKALKESVIHYPLLIRDVSEPKKLLQAPTGEIIKISKDGMVWLLTDPESKEAKGWELIYRHLPFKTEISEIGMNAAGDFILLLFHINLSEIVLINLTTGYNHKITFPQWSSSLQPEFTFDAGLFWFASTKNYWSISPEGIIKEHAVFSTTRNKISSVQLGVNISRHLQIGGGVLKKVKNVYINTGGNLVVNSHLLSLSGSGAHQTLKFHHSGNKTVHKSAKLVEENRFQFENGSTVEVDRVGMLLLRHPDETIPCIYIPTSLGTILGVATHEEFAGYEYYYNTQRQGIILYDTGPDKLSVVKHLKEHLSLGLKEAKDLADQSPSWIDMNAIQRSGFSSSVSFVKGLKDLQATVIMRDSKTIKKIELQEFYSKHLQPYIKNILKDGI